MVNPAEQESSSLELSFEPAVENADENEETIISRLKDHSLEWVDSDDREAEFRSQLKTIADRKKVLGPLIQEDLQKLNKTELTLRRGGKLKFTTTTTTTALKRDELVTAIKSEISDESLANSIVEKVFDKSARSGKTVTTLKRTKK